MSRGEKLRLWAEFWNSENQKERRDFLENFNKNLNKIVFREKDKLYDESQEDKLLQISRKINNAINNYPNFLIGPITEDDIIEELTKYGEPTVQFPGKLNGWLDVFRNMGISEKTEILWKVILTSDPERKINILPLILEVIIDISK
eukprot:GHVL01039266.1.p1 GENE.GHVL01039266.1~~GHVL01039266.1.p1  ORF type:complete len:146 (+),score=23.86 GHVL01039266.1:213-650(+)